MKNRERKEYGYSVHSYLDDKGERVYELTKRYQARYFRVIYSTEQKAFAEGIEWIKQNRQRKNETITT